jgi:hypothetical protein
MTEIVPLLPDAHSPVWTCRCGNQFFLVRGDNAIQCAGCGRLHFDTVHLENRKLMPWEWTRTPSGAAR